MKCDYKEIIKSRSIRLKILQMLSIIPDKPMIKLQYRIKTGNKLNLKNPKRFTEKLQWYKLYYRDPLMIQCVDKYDVREYVKSKGLEDILIPCYGVFDSADDINWEELPNQFVMKDTLGSGGNTVIIVKDKSTVNLNDLKEKAKQWTLIDAHRPDGGREWPYYSGKKHRIIIEKYIDSDEKNGGLIDYKFFCFDGKAAYMYVIADRELGNGAGMGIYDSSFNQLNVTRMDEKILKRFIEKPSNFGQLKSVAEKLSDKFPEARIDLYDCDGIIMFGEITFFDGSGYMKYDPDEFDFELGDAFKLPKSGGGIRIASIQITLEHKIQRNHGLIDYKFFCFNGKVEFLYVMADRKVGNSVSVGIYDRNFNLLPVQRIGDTLFSDIQKPDNYNCMIAAVEKLSADFPHVRVDLYDQNETIQFGELTFYNASGYMKYEPDSFDFYIGEKFNLK